MKKLLYLLLFPLSSFAQTTDFNLNLEADTIRTETHAGRNTAQRIGRMYKNIIASKLNIGGGTVVPVVNGGTGTSSPSLVAGTNISITGSWPNQTINATGVITSLTTSGTSGAATLVGSTLNVPNYSGGGTALIDNIINIGSWNMSTTSFITVNHGLTQSKIRSVSVYIQDDTPTNQNQLPYIVAGTPVAWIGATTSTQVFISCSTGAFGAGYSGAGNRGYIVIRTTP